MEFIYIYFQFICYVSHHVDVDWTYWLFDNHMWYTHVYVKMDHELPYVDPIKFCVEISWSNLEPYICIPDYVQFWHVICKKNVNKLIIESLNKLFQII